MGYRPTAWRAGANSVERDGISHGDPTSRNTRTAIAFYDLMFNQCRPVEAVERHFGERYFQRYRVVRDGNSCPAAHG